MLLLAEVECTIVLLFHSDAEQQAEQHAMPVRRHVKMQVCVAMPLLACTDQHCHGIPRRVLAYAICASDLSGLFIAVCDT